MSNNTTGSPVNWTFLYPMAPNAVISLLGMCGGVMTVLGIATCKKLHSPCFTLIASSGIGSFIVAAACLSVPVEKIGSSLGIIPMERPGALCMIISPLLGLLGITFHALMTLSVSLDRLFGILAPNRYRLLGKRYAIGILVACVCFVMGHTVVAFGTAELTKRIVCTPAAALHPLFVVYSIRLNLSLIAMTVLAYGMMWTVFRIRLKKHKTQQDQFMKLQLAVVPTIKAMALLYFLTGVLSEILMNIAAALPVGGTAAFIVMTTVQYLKTASSLVEVSALMMRNQEFRGSCRALMGMKPQATATVAVPVGINQRNLPVTGNGGRWGQTSRKRAAK